MDMLGFNKLKITHEASLGSISTVDTPKLPMNLGKSPKQSGSPIMASPRQQFRQNLLKVDIPNSKSSFNFLLNSCSASDLRNTKEEAELLTSEKMIYTVLETIGKGHQARVAKVEGFAKKEINISDLGEEFLRPNNQNQLAAKILIHSEDDEIRKTIEKEYNLLSRLNHPNLLKVKEVFPPKEKPELLVMIMEYFESLTLKDYIDKYSNEKGNFLPRSNLIKISKQLLDTMAYLHKMKISHRDLSLENILISEKDLSLKVVDFGLAKEFDVSSEKVVEILNMMTVVGLPIYRAPEMLRNDIYTEKIDIWMCGLIVLQLCMGKSNISTRSVINKLKSKDKAFSEYTDFSELIELMLVIDPLERASFQEIEKKLSLIEE